MFCIVIILPALQKALPKGIPPLGHNRNAPPPSPPPGPSMRLLPACLCVVFLAFPALAQRVDAPTGTAPTKVAEVEGITEYRLANGLKVLLFPDPSKPTI